MGVSLVSPSANPPLGLVNLLSPISPRPHVTLPDHPTPDFLCYFGSFVCTLCFRLRFRLSLLHFLQLWRPPRPPRCWALRSSSRPQARPPGGAPAVDELRAPKCGLRMPTSLLGPFPGCRGRAARCPRERLFRQRRVL